MTMRSPVFDSWASNLKFLGTQLPYLEKCVCHDLLHENLILSRALIQGCVGGFKENFEESKTCLQGN